MDHSARSVQIQRRSEFWRPKKNVTQPAALIVPTRPPTRTTRPTATPGKYVFLGNLPKNPYPAPAPDPLLVDPNLLTGVADIALQPTAPGEETRISFTVKVKQPGTTDPIWTKFHLENNGVAFCDVYFPLN